MNEIAGYSTIHEMKFHATIRRLLLIYFAFLTCRPTEIDVFRGFGIHNLSLLTILGFFLVFILNRKINIFIILAFYYISITLVFDIYDWPMSMENLSLSFQVALFFLFLYSVVVLISQSHDLLIFYLKWQAGFAMALWLLVLLQDASQYGTYSQTGERFYYPYIPLGLDKNTFAFIQAAGFSISIFVLMEAIKKRDALGVIYKLGSLIMGISTFFIGSRTALVFLMGIASIFLVNVFTRKIRRVNKFLMLFILLFGAFIGAIYASQYTNDQFRLDFFGGNFNSFADRSSSDELRLQENLISLTEFVRGSFLGQGINGAVDSYLYAGFNTIEHNQILFFSNAYGVFFLLPFLLFCIERIRCAVRSGGWFGLSVLLLIFLTWTTTPFMVFFAMHAWLIIFSSNVKFLLFEK